ncbi:MAG: inositol monophosphatase family protein [Pseudomonadota bacterium]
MTKTPIIDVMHRALDASDAVIRPYFRALDQVDDKTGGAPSGAPGSGDHASDAPAFDPVTEADRAAEQAIIEVIRDAFPDDAIVGEESGRSDGATSRTWIIDPIDGTRAFVAGLPTFGTLLGLLEDGVPRFGAMSQPILAERFVGGDVGRSGGDGTRADSPSSSALAQYVSRSGEKSPLRVSGVRDLEAAMLATTDPYLFSADERRAFDACLARCRMIRFGGDCYSYCLLAAGHIDLIIESGLQAYDIAPLVPIIEAAGGVVTSWSGGAAAGGGQVIAAASEALADAARALLSGAAQK